MAFRTRNLAVIVTLLPPSFHQFWHSPPHLVNHSVPPRWADFTNTSLCLCGKRHVKTGGSVLWCRLPQQIIECIKYTLHTHYNLTLCMGHIFYNHKTNDSFSRRSENNLWRSSFKAPLLALKAVCLIALLIFPSDLSLLGTHTNATVIQITTDYGA